MRDKLRLRGHASGCDDTSVSAITLYRPAPTFSVDTHKVSRTRAPRLATPVQCWTSLSYDRISSPVTVSDQERNHGISRR
jgi:hypothetical protein